MSRPSEAEVRVALDDVSEGASPWALRTLRAATNPRPVWPAKEAAACLGVDPSNLGDLRGMPAPAQQLARPSVTHPEKTMSLWFVDEIEEFAARRRAERGGT